MSPAATPHMCPASELSGAATWLSRTCTAQMYLQRKTCVEVCSCRFAVGAAGDGGKGRCWLYATSAFQAWHKLCMKHRHPAAQP